jgi:uncharacterized protein YcnI
VISNREVVRRTRGALARCARIRPSHSLIRIAITLTFLMGGVALLNAHVTVQPREVRANGFEKFMVRVPSEKPEATVKVRLEFPEGLGSPRFQPKTGWTYEIEKDATGRITAVTWSGGQIGPQEFEEFAFSARAPAQPGSLSFKAWQTYQSGLVVAWVGPVGSAEPASVVTVKDTASFASGTPAAATGNGGPSSRNWLSMLALLLAAVAVVMSIVGMRRRTT